MSTIADFENALVGSTATSRKGNIAIKTGKSTFEWTIYDPDGQICDALNSYEMVDPEKGDFTLNPVMPTTAREVLELVWELAHPVKDGQVIPVGTWLVERRGDGFAVGKNDYFEATANDWDVKNRRTLDQLLEPDPEWLDAPAVIASVKDEDSSLDRQIFARLPGGRWAGRYGNWETYETWELTDVTPLYPKENEK